MKRVPLTLCILVGCSSWAWAVDQTVNATLPATTQADIMPTILTGMVKSVSWADPTKGTKSEIIVKDGKGKLTNILVTSTTTLWDADTKAIMPDKIVAKCKVNVIYLTTPEGIKIGKSIKIIK